MSNALVFLVDGIPTTTSLKVAETFGKRHDVVIRGIRDLQNKCPEGFTAHNFVASEYTDNTGRKLPMYMLTRDGLTLLVMGYTGKEAMKFKLAYIDAFNSMEKELMRRQNSALPPADRSDLKALVDAKLSTCPAHLQGKARSELWARFNRHFRIAEYAQLPPEKMADARDYIITLELRALSAVETRKAPALPKVKASNIHTDLSELKAVQSKLDLLLHTVPLHGLRGYSTGDDRAERELVLSRNAHIRTATNCLVIAKMAIEAAIA